MVCKTENIFISCDHLVSITKEDKYENYVKINLNMKFSQLENGKNSYVTSENKYREPNMLGTSDMLRLPDLIK